MLGFTHEALKDVPVTAVKTTHTVDASIGLEAALVVLILEQKRQYGKNVNLYDVKRLVPSLTRGSNGLVIMWMPFAFDSIPKNQLPEGDGTRAIYENIKALDWFPCEQVVDWFIRSHNALCNKQEDGAKRADN